MVQRERNHRNLYTSKEEMRDIFEKVDFGKPLPKLHDCVGIFMPKKIKNYRDLYNSRGEFAGYYVEDKDNLVLFRDRLGARNIYYLSVGPVVYISTDLKKLASLCTMPNSIHIASDYRHFQIPFSDETFFHNIKKVMPGEFVRIPRSGDVERKKYWEPEFGNKSFDRFELMSRVHNAVEFRLNRIGDEKYTSYLSGGIDSSSMTLLANPKECFSGFYMEEGFSEMEYIEAVAQTAGNKTVLKVTIDKTAFHKQLSDLANICPDPSCGLGVIPQVLVAKRAAAHGYKYAFTGEGGDEIFTGYNWNRIVFKLAQALRELHEDRYMVRYDPMVDHVLKNGFPTLVGGLLGRSDNLLFATDKILEIWRDDLCVENNILNINLTVGLPAILTVDEQVGRFSGVEPVSPIMDHEIVEYVCSLKPSERGSIPKEIYRGAMREVLPEKVRTRYDKMGFPVPFNNWDWPMLRPALESLQERGVVSFDIDDYKTMNRQSWALYNIEMWYQRFVDSSYRRIR